MVSLALGVTFRQTLQSFPFLEDFHKNPKQGLLFFPVNFGFGKCKHLSYSVPIYLFLNLKQSLSFSSLWHAGS